MKLYIFIYFFLPVALISGWILNIYQIATAENLSIGILIVKIAGIFVFPIGSIMGFIGL